ncbi:MAG: S24/S26 family peptidase [Candidatus Omnitrophica bacterium]|nr:S24/S26 family peptidase [Candidatus Omnitrophota bacterium]
MNLLYVRLKGGCMRPLLIDEQVVLILPLYKKVKPGDVVLYRLEGQLFLHRVVKLSSKSMFVEDDSGITCRVVVPLKDVLGIYPTILSGFLGYIYHILVRTVYITFRSVKKLFLQKI